jgi:hypothetical protein
MYTFAVILRAMVTQFTWTLHKYFDFTQLQWETVPAPDDFLDEPCQWASVEQACSAQTFGNQVVVYKSMGYKGEKPSFKSLEKTGTKRAWFPP